MKKFLNFLSAETFFFDELHRRSHKDELKKSMRTFIQA